MSYKKISFHKAEIHQIANIHWIIEKAKEFQKKKIFCFRNYTKAFVWFTTNCENFLKRRE